MRFKPRRSWFGKEGIGVDSSGLSVMKSGYTSIDLVNCLSACHALESGWLYPACNCDAMSPATLTLVAAVEVYDRAREGRDIEDLVSSGFRSRYEMSFKNDIVAV
jgi:hypothetical protein